MWLCMHGRGRTVEAWGDGVGGAEGTCRYACGNPAGEPPARGGGVPCGCAMHMNGDRWLRGKKGIGITARSRGPKP